MKPPTKPTPLELLLADKERIRQQCRQQEQKLNEACVYVQENTGSLLLSGLSSMLFPDSGAAKKKTKDTAVAGNLPATVAPATSFGLSDVLSIGKMMIPVMWEIAQPLIIAWGIRKVKTFIGRVFRVQGTKFKV